MKHHLCNAQKPPPLPPNSCQQLSAGYYSLATLVDIRSTLGPSRRQNAIICNSTRCERGQYFRGIHAPTSDPVGRSINDGDVCRVASRRDDYSSALAVEQAPLFAFQALFARSFLYQRTLCETTG
jgi:hypothetical protein